MKLNFWQWLGVVLLVIATVFWIMQRRDQSREADFGTPTLPFTDDAEEPMTDPMAEPATTPAP